jgi:tetratricopeptide (TPR) repeat protein
MTGDMRSRHLFVFLLFLALLLVRGVAADDLRTLSDGITLVSSGEYDAALLLLYPLAQDHKEDAVYQFWLGRAYYGQRFYLLAARSLGEAVNRDAGNRDACLWYMRALRSANRLREAREVAPLFLNRFPDDITIVTEFAIICQMVGESSAGSSAFTKLVERDPAPETRAYVEELQKSLSSYTTKLPTEPPNQKITPTFELRYSCSTFLMKQLLQEIERVRDLTSDTFHMDVTGFRVLAYTDWPTYIGAGSLMTPDGGPPPSTAFSFNNVLVLRVPDRWPDDKGACDDLSRLFCHEFAHIALYQRTAGQGIPLWMNEGLACYYGGTAGVATGQLPDKLYSVRQLDQLFQYGKGEKKALAYAQAYVMGTALAKHLGPSRLLKFIDQLANGVPLSTAYKAITSESWDDFLANWQKWAK